MKYLNGTDIFPSELLDLIQDYTQGKYVYIPKRDKNRENWGTNTPYKKELAARNNHIFSEAFSGLSTAELACRYCLSVKSIRRILLSMRKEAEKMKTIIKQVLLNWNISSSEEIVQVYPTAWSIGDKYILKANTDLGNLNRNIIMMKVLKDCGIPVAYPLQTIGNDDYIEYKETYFLLMNKLPGKHIEDVYKANYSDISYKTGKIIARLHKAFLSCEQKITFWNNSLFDEMQGWIYDSLKSFDFKYISELEFKDTLAELKKCYDMLPRQLIHRDLYYGNMLFNNDEFSGYVDFDLSQKNARIFDLCYFQLGLLINRDKNTTDVEKWYLMLSNLIKGYEFLSPLTIVEKESLCCIMKCIEILFTAYFLNEQDDLSARNSSNLFHFIKNNESKINQIVQTA